MVYQSVKWLISLAMAKWFNNLAKWFINLYYTSVLFDKKLLTVTVSVNKYCLNVAYIFLKVCQKADQILALVFVKGVQLC